MNFFTTLLIKILPLYFMIFIGFVSGRRLNINRDTIAELLLYMLAPVIIFNGVVKTKLDFNLIFIPVLTYGISAFLCFIFYQAAKRHWKDGTENLVAMSAGAGNTGYIGLPVALLLFNEQGEGVYILSMLGVTLFENSIGFYVLAKGTHTSRECLYKVLKLPTLYAFILGLIVNLLNIAIPSNFQDALIHIKGAYTVLGMMMIGLGISLIKTFKIDYKFIGMTFLAKFAIWPLLTLFLILIDSYFFHFFNIIVYDALMLISIVPIAANSVPLASILKNHPEKAATAVALSIFFAIVYIPIMSSHFIEGSKETKLNTEIVEQSRSSKQVDQVDQVEEKIIR